MDKHFYLKVSVVISFILTCFSAAILTATVLSPLVYRPLISLFHLDQTSGLSSHQVMESYQQIVDYLLFEFGQDLSLKYFSSSVQGLQHFSEVKALLFIVFVVLVITSFLSIWCVLKLKKKRQQRKMKTYFGIATFFPLAMLFVMVVAFDRFFVFFHEILFNNNYWIFDPLMDPVIQILPQEFFLIIFLLTILIYELYLFILKKILER